MVDLALHGVGTQLYTAQNTRITLKAINWYGFEYAPFVPDGLDRAPLDSILFNVRRLGFNTLRLTFADQTVRSNPIVTQGVQANPDLRGLHALDIMGRIIARAHAFGLRVILCNSRSEAGRGPETASGLWYTAAYPEAVWQADWKTIVSRFGHDSAFVGADLRNEPHDQGSGSVTQQTYLTAGPVWGAFQGTYYWRRDWRLAAERMGNDLLRIDPSLLIIVEGVQVYVSPSGTKPSGGLWGSNLRGVRYAPIRLIRPGQLVYSVHEYGPQMWQGDWFNTKTTYLSLSRRWTRLWGYLLHASRALQAPIFVGEFGTCDNYWSCITDTDGWKQGFWFKSFIRYLHEHTQLGWAYWALNPTGPFHAGDANFYSLVSADWRHYYPLVIRGLAPLLQQSTGSALRRASLRLPAFTPVPGCSPTRSCSFASPLPKRGGPLPFTVRQDVPYVQPADPTRSGDLYLPQTVGTGARPAVVIVHGGSWDNGQKGTPGTTILAQSLAQHGYVAFDINYRLAGGGGEYPRNIRDVDDAVAYLAAHALTLKIDPGKLSVVGISSGGYLALMAAYRQGIAPFIAPHYRGMKVHIRAVGAFFSPVELKSSIRASGDVPWVQNLATYMGGATYDENPDGYTMASPLRYADTGVPTVLWYADSSPVTPAPQSFELYKRLRQRQIETQLFNMSGTESHLTDLLPQARHTVAEQLLGFLDDVLQHPATVSPGT